MKPTVAHVALPIPLHQTFDYRIGATIPVVGARVIVPFGPHQKIGIVTATSQHSDFPLTQLKPIHRVLDDASPWPPALFKLLLWASQYYQHPLGEIFEVALPNSLRQGKPAIAHSEKYWQLTALGRAQDPQQLKRATKQARVLNLLAPKAQAHSALLQADINASVLHALAEKKWIETCAPKPKLHWSKKLQVIEEKPQLNSEQAICVATIKANPAYACYLVDGITGSGKTEVYLNLIESTLQQGKQALVLVPEIGLTPQTIQRFKCRFNVPISVLHSGLNDSERFKAWLAAKNNDAAIIIGTRSALFSPCFNLGIIIVDEEHDASYKQQDTFRYHARDLAVLRAYEENIPILLGSATPSFESLHNAYQGKYHHLQLTMRAGNAIKAKHGILDIRGLYLKSGLSAPLIAEMRQHLSAGNQVMLFLNRRGFAPVMMCHECGWLAKCHRCEVYYTLHQHIGELRCHHCGGQHRVPHQCADCGSTQLISVGVGTEQLETHLNQLFPEYSTVRIDRDNIRRKGALEGFLNAIYAKKHQILIGTQMLAKGHHFPDVTLVALVDVDSALFSQDFRAAERLAQLFIQVAGRAGRASKPGTVLLQTHHPQHPLMQSLVHQSYSAFAQTALKERRDTQLPPYCFFVLFRAEALQLEMGEQFLQSVKNTLQAHPLFCSDAAVFGPAPAPMAKRAGKYRWQLIFQAPTRKYVQEILSISLPMIRQLPLAKKVKWSLDVEPQEMS